MSPEEQRIAIAEACGWKFIEKLAFTGIPKGSRGNADARAIPDYLNDLNAMHEAEKMLEDPLRFASTLAGVLGCAWYQSNKLLFATAAQRAEAFLRTLGLWREQK